MSNEPIQTPSQPSSPEPAPDVARKPYERPVLVEYGDIATLTQTGGLTRADLGQKKRRV